MNINQRRIIRWAVFVFLLATLFPPWVHTSNGHKIESAGFSCILLPPTPKHQGVEMDTSRLMLEWVFILAAAGAACFFLNGETVPASAAPAIVPSQRKSFWPISMKQWLFIAGLVVLAAGSTAITVITLHESSKNALLSHKPTSMTFEEFTGHNPKPSASEFLADATPHAPRRHSYTFDEAGQTVEQLRTLAENGEADAQAELGYRFLNGNGVIKDYDEAAKLFRKSADQGNALAQADLGFCYANGFGVPKDYCDGCVQAYMWYNLAAAQGQPESANNLALLEKKMTPGQIAEAQRLSRKFKAFKVVDSGIDTTNSWHIYDITVEGEAPFRVELDRPPTQDDFDYIVERRLDDAKAAAKTNR